MTYIDSNQLQSKSEVVWAGVETSPEAFVAAVLIAFGVCPYNNTGWNKVAMVSWKQCGWSFLLEVARHIKKLGKGVKYLYSYLFKLFPRKGHQEYISEY